MQDIEFNSTEIISGSAFILNGKITVNEAKVGCLFIEDHLGRLVMAPQTQIGSNVEIDLSGFQIGSSIWKIHFPQGDPGENTSGGISAKEAMLYALLFE